jgi:CubicO group peptidase (beta-lactamase class C family)
MLTHTSGNAVDMLNPVLMAWRKNRGEESNAWATSVTELFELPLIFNPGEGWVYGGGFEWGGKVLSRLNGGMSCEEYVIENIFKPLGCKEPWPTFDVAKHPDTKILLVETAQRTENGGTAPTVVPTGENVKDEMGGSGLVLSADHYTAVLSDIISDTPKLLKLETVTALFTPQFLPGSKELEGLRSPEGRLIYSVWSGVNEEDQVNHALGGLFVRNEQSNFGQPDSMMMWDGALNTAWFASRKHGVAGVICCQLIPPSDPKFVELFSCFKKDFWKTWQESHSKN